MGRIVIVAMRAQPGQLAALRALVGDQVSRLRAEDLATDCEPIIVEAANDTIIEVFEWRSKAAIEAAHTNPAVTAMWGEFASVCEFVPIADVAELFSEFAPVD